MLTYNYVGKMFVSLTLSYGAAYFSVGIFNFNCKSGGMCVPYLMFVIYILKENVEKLLVI